MSYYPNQPDQPVLRYSICQHRDNHAVDALPGDSGHHVRSFALAHEACNTLMEIADMWQREGGTVEGAGFRLWVTAPDGEKITYRVWGV